MQLTAAMRNEILALPSDTIGVTPLSGKITNVQYGQHPTEATAVGTIVTLEFTLLGCADQLGCSLYYADVQGNQVTFYVITLNAHTERSKHTACLLPSKALKQMFVPDKKIDRRHVYVVFLNMLLMEAMTDSAGNQSVTDDRFVGKSSI
jgi:hypothetical protein